MQLLEPPHEMSHKFHLGGMRNTRILDGGIHAHVVALGKAKFLGYPHHVFRYQLCPFRSKAVAKLLY